ERVAQPGVQVAVEALELLVDLGVDAHRFAQDEAREGRVLMKRLEDARDGDEELIADRRRAFPQIHADDVLADLLEQEIEQLVEDGVLAVEIDVEGAARDARRFDDVADAGVVIALVAEDGEGRVEDGAAAPLAL